MTGINFGMSVWSAAHLNLSMKNCQMRSLNIKTTETRLHVSNSKMGSSIQIMDGSGMFVNCSFFGTNMSARSALISAENATVILKAMRIVNWQGREFLQISSGTGRITDVTFENCTAASSLIHVFNESKCTIENCKFLSNSGQIFNTQIKSVGTVQNAHFTDNKILHLILNLPLIQCGLESHLELRNSHFVNNTIMLRAGGLFVNQSSCNVSNCSFKNNNVADNFAVVSVVKNGILKINKTIFSNNTGGAVSFHNSSNFVVSNCHFLGNSAEKGGAIFFQSKRDTNNKSKSVTSKKPFELSVPRITTGTVANCSFLDNTARNGGAIAAEDVALILHNNMFANNSGGAVALFLSPANFTSCIFLANKASGEGGAISSYLASLFVFSSTFTANEAADTRFSGGGAIVVASARKVILSNSTFHRNIGTRGGAIDASAVNLVMDNSTFIENNGRQGGAAYCSQSAVILKHSSFQSNTALASGGALEFELSSICTMEHVHFSNNSAQSGGAIFAGRNLSLFCNFCTFSNNSAYLK